MCGRFTAIYTWEEIHAYYRMIDELARNGPAAGEDLLQKWPV